MEQYLEAFYDSRVKEGGNNKGIFSWNGMQGMQNRGEEQPWRRCLQEPENHVMLKDIRNEAKLALSNSVVKYWPSMRKANV